MNEVVGSWFARIVPLSLLLSALATVGVGSRKSKSRGQRESDL
jgi:hypothetical protein